MSSVQIDTLFQQRALEEQTVVRRDAAPKPKRNGSAPNGSTNGGADNAQPHAGSTVGTDARSAVGADTSPAEQPLPAKDRRREFPYGEFALDLDPAVVKARYQVGPVDPTILFVGDLDERHGPDLLIRAMPPILKNHPQARLVIVGDGPLLWPLRVMSRYMLLDYAVRIAGHVGGREVRELVAAADVIAVPSRVQTEDWQILAGWSARRPVVATHAVGSTLCKHEDDGVLVYANPGSCVWGIERVLFDAEFRRKLGERGYDRVVTGLLDCA